LGDRQQINVSATVQSVVRSVFVYASGGEGGSEQTRRKTRAQKAAAAAAAEAAVYGLVCTGRAGRSCHTTVARSVRRGPARPAVA